MLIFLSPLRSWEGVWGTLPNCSTWGEGGARDCSGPVGKAGDSELSPGCQQNGKCCSMEWGLCASLRIQGDV